jgi:mycothiol synthase
MQLKENALLALDTIHQKPVQGIPTGFIHPMEHRIIDLLAGVPEGTYQKKPIETYMGMQKNVGACMCDQWIPTNPLSMGEKGYEAGTKKSATTGIEQIVRDGMAIDSPEAAVAHMEQKIFPDLRQQIEAWDQDPASAEKDLCRQILIGEETTQLLLGENILKVPYGCAGFPIFLYGMYGYENYFMAYALYPEVIERYFSLRADLSSRRNKAVARAYTGGKLPPLLRLDHDMADSRGTLVDIKSLDKIWFPHFSRSIKPLLEAGVKMIWHCDGNLMQMVPRLLEAGLVGFQGFQYEDGMDYEKICRMKTRDGNPLIIEAGVSVTRTLPFGKPDDIRKEIKWLVDNGPKTGLILAGSSSIAPGVPWENIKVFTDGLNYYRQHGRDNSGTPPSATQRQLQMIFPPRLLPGVPVPKLPRGYLLRQYSPEDEKDYLDLMAKAGFKNWTGETMKPWLDRVIPEGFFVIEHKPTKKLVATAMATHHPKPEMPSGGGLGWVAGDPEHSGHGLGQAICSAAVKRFAKAGYRNVYLLTDDFRLPAIKVYLKLGFKPYIYSPDMEARWQKVCSELKWPYEPVQIRK